jgi:dephospho-CoA kinase
MMIIGLTGGIATGKSTACRCFSRHGYVVIDADAISRKLMEKGRAGWKKTIALFGKGITDEGNAVDRARLAELVYMDGRKLKQLEAILHPLVISVIRRRLEDQYARDLRSIVIVDAPLLFEKLDPALFHGIVVVACAGSVQIERLKRYRRYPAYLKKRIVQQQMPLEEKVKRADWVLENNGTIAALERKVLAIAKRFDIMNKKIENGEKLLHWKNLQL